ncbi:NUDIX domain-containing protein [Bacillus nitratireducens]|uniref:NUDIX domain-containing protein n=1 Tax=Bacillus nitratireducens TaxID=2026193 RepID=UPI001BAA6840|nr:NUDIX hydrolase [Bacillus nitratireducens]QUG84530.1 NUDIX domain-containing protein [Bacillus nitratireducens]
MIRQAVGAVVFQHSEFLLVHKVKISDIDGEYAMSKGEWDFPKGGVKHTDNDLESAILRELEEETGSTKFKVIKQFEDKICFGFPEELKMKIGYEEQETTMFYVEYIGDRIDLHPKDNEISQVQFFKIQDVLRVLSHEDTKKFFEGITQKMY